MAAFARTRPASPSRHDLPTSATALERQLYRAMNELERIQPRRRGENCSSTVGDEGLGPALNHENYETNPKQFLRILFKCNGFARFWCFFARETNPKLPAPLARTLVEGLRP
jgi:hypothetical protein